MDDLFEEKEHLLEQIEDVFRRVVLEEITKSTNNHDKLWTIEETATYLGIKPQTLSVWNSNGKGPPPTKIGGRTMYIPELVREYTRHHTRPR